MSSFITQIYKKTKTKPVGVAFLDRDGTIVRGRDFLTEKEEIKFYKHTSSAISLLNKNNFLVIIITNQPVVARGWISEEELKEINNLIVKKLNKKGVIVNAIYSCPHHPEANIKKYKKICSCRKPGTLMLEEAMKDFRIKNKPGFMVGDKTVDVKCGKDFGIKSILLKTGYYGSDKKYGVKPDFIKANLLSAAKLMTSSIISP